MMSTNVATISPAETILSAHREALGAMAGELLERETLDAGDIERLFADVPKWRRDENDNGVLHRGPEPVDRNAAA